MADPIDDPTTGSTQPESAQPEHDEHAPAESDVPLDPKAAFAAALARKKAAGQQRSAHLDAHGGVGGSTANHKATRQFRRKSG